MRLHGCHETTQTSPQYNNEQNKKCAITSSKIDGYDSEFIGSNQFCESKKERKDLHYLQQIFRASGRNHIFKN